MRVSRALQHLATLLVMVIVLVACGGPTASTAPSGATAPSAGAPSPDGGSAAPSGPTGELRIAVTTFGPETWDPIKGDSATGNTMHAPIFDWLVEIIDGEAVPQVLESFQVSDDGLAWDLKLRSGLTFHDGSPVTVEDLEFTFDRYRSEDAFRATMRTYVASTEVIDDLTLRVNTNGPHPYFPWYISSVFPGQGSLMPKAYIEENGLDHFLQNPIGVGPWRLESWQEGVSMTFTAVEDHWRITPAFERMTVSLIPDLNTQQALLETGEMDVIQITLDNAEALRGAGYNLYDLIPSQIRIDTKAAYDPRAEGMPVTDIRVREALARAINYDEIASTILGTDAPAVPPRALFGMPEVDFDKWTPCIRETRGYDPERARQLMAEAGYADGFDIQMFISQPGGASAFINDVAEIVQAYWAEIGVRGEIVILELPEYQGINREPVDRVVGQIVFGSTGVLAPAPTNMEWVWGSNGGSPLHAWNPPEGEKQVFVPELDELLYSAQSEIDSAKRIELIDQLIQTGLDTYTSFMIPEAPVRMATSPQVQFVDLGTPVMGQWIPQYADRAIHAP
jgi:peptide/nickel transport system substrate-binding protein